jgi:protein disulfide-isomerase A1
LAHIFVSTPSERTQFAIMLRSLAEKYKDKMNFALVDSELYRHRARILQLPTNKFPAFAIENVVSTEKYPFLGEDITSDAIAQFVDDYLMGNLRPSVRSQPIPEIQSGTTIELVGETFNQIVGDNDRDILVEFYVPWCEYCSE